MKDLNLRRKNALNLFREAAKLGSFDEFPVLRPKVDPQLHVNANDVSQPFYLCCEKDSVIALVSGSATVEFADGAVRYFDLEPGDFVYVPGGVEHRIRIKEAGIQLRYKACDAGLEAVSWRCADCGNAVCRYTWDTAEILPQEGYLSACEQFNRSDDLRVCSVCGAVHAPVDMQSFRWRDIAELLRDQADVAV